MVWANRAACYLRLGLCDKALQDAQIARVLDPKYVKVRGRNTDRLKRNCEPWCTSGRWRMHAWGRGTRAARVGYRQPPCLSPA